MAISNNERGGSRTKPALDALKGALGLHLPHIGVSDDIFYGYCVNCEKNPSSVVLMVTASLSKTNMAVAKKFPHIYFLAVNDMQGDVFSMTPATGGNVGSSFTMDAKRFADSAYDLLCTAHTCRGSVAHPVLPTGRLDRVNMSKYTCRRIRGDLHMDISALLRCPVEPFRVLDMDMVLVDLRTGEIKLIVEESAVAKNTYMSETLARNVGAPMAKIITRNPYTGAAEITVWETRGRELNAPPPRFSSYQDFFEKWCVPVLGA